MITLKKVGNPIAFVSVLILISIILRFLWLNIFPVGMTNDELEYILSSKTYALYGRDISGSTFPTSLFVNRTEGVISAIPPLLVSPIYLLLPLNQFTARLPYAIINILTAFAVFYLAFILSKKKVIGALAALFFLVSPWSMFLSRNTVDSSFSLLFYTWGVVAFLKCSGKLLIVPPLLFLLGFFSYHGAKPILLPLFLACIGYRLWLSEDNKIKIKEGLLLVICAISILVAYVLINNNLPNSILSNKSADLFLVDTSSISSKVDDLRRTTIESPLEGLFINKFVASLQTLINSYLQAFSTSTLFINGDPRATYHFGEHGLLYYFDLILIIFGVIYLYRQNKGALLFLVSILLIAPIPTAINKIEISVINRSFIMLPTLMILSGAGIYLLVTKAPRKIGSIPIALAAFAIFLFSVANFYHFYFYTFPIKGQETYLFSEKVLTRYLKIDPDHKTVVISEKPRSAYFRAIFYSDQNTQKKFLKESYISPDRPSYVFNNIEYTSSCPTQFSKDTRYMVSRKIDNCLGDFEYNLSITDQRDAGDVYKIYNSNTCLGVSNERWKRFHSINEYKLDELTNDEFCNKWISKTDL